MFGGHGVFRDGLMFGLVAERDPLKATRNRAMFSRDCSSTRKHNIPLSYYLAPEALEDRTN